MSSPIPEERRLSALTGAAFYCIFTALGAIISVFLTIIKFRSAVQCDESLLSACQLGAWFDCNSVLTSPWSVWFEVPISVYATAFYLTGFWLSARLLRNPGDLLRATRPLLMSMAWLGLLVVIPLAWYAAFEVGSFCTFCVLIYLVNIALLFAAWLVNPQGPIGGLSDILSAQVPRRTFTIFTAALLFSAVLAVQMAVYMKNAVSVEVEAQCIKIGGKLPPPALVRGAPEPQAEIALFVDFACPACRIEYTHWRRDIEATADRYRLSIYHFPREGECLSKGTSFNPNSVYHHACRAARALECVEQAKPGAGWAMADALFASQEDAGEPLFSQTRLAELANKIGVTVAVDDKDDPFYKCLRDDTAVLDKIRKHADFGLNRGLTETPGTFFIFFHPNGVPFEKIPLVKGAKTYLDIDDYIKRARERVEDDLEDAPIEL